MPCMALTEVLPNCNVNDQEQLAAELITGAKWGHGTHTGDLMDAAIAESRSTENSKTINGLEEQLHAKIVAKVGPPIRGKITSTRPWPCECTKPSSAGNKSGNTWVVPDTP